MKKPNPEVTVTQSPDDQVPVEILASAITAIADGTKKLLAGPLNEKTIVQLIASSAPLYGPTYRKAHVTTAQVKATLAGMESLKRSCLK